MEVLRVERIINSKTFKISNPKNLSELHVLLMQLVEESKIVKFMGEITLSSNVSSAVLLLNGSAGEQLTSVMIATLGKTRETTSLKRSLLNFLNVRENENALLR